MSVGLMCIASYLSSAGGFGTRTVCHAPLQCCSCAFGFQLENSFAGHVQAPSLAVWSPCGPAG